MRERERWATAALFYRYPSVERLPTQHHPNLKGLPLCFVQTTDRTDRAESRRSGLLTEIRHLLLKLPKLSGEFVPTKRGHDADPVDYEGSPLDHAQELLARTQPG